MAHHDLTDWEYFDLQWLEAETLNEPLEQNDADNSVEPEPVESASPSKMAEHDLLDEKAEQALAQALQHCFDRIISLLSKQENTLELLIDQLQNNDGLDERQLNQILTLFDLLLVKQFLREKETEPQTQVLYDEIEKQLFLFNWDRDQLLHLAQQTQNTTIELSTVLSDLYQIRNHLVTTNIRLVYHIALKYRDSGLEIDDLVQEGIVGLMRAAFKFDAKAENRFTTYAYWWIKQAIKQAISKQRSLIRYPVQIDQKVRSFYAFRERFRTHHGHWPDSQTIAKNTQLSTEHQRDIEKLGNFCVSANTPKFDDRIKTLQDDLTANDPLLEPAEQVDLLSQQKDIDALFRCLSTREKTALKLKYGIHQRRTFSLREIAPQLGVSTERTRQIIQEALLKIRNQ